MKYTIKKKNSSPISSQEHVMSEEVKAFRRAALKMNKGDSIHVKFEERRKILNFLRNRKLIKFFKSRTISKENDIIAIYCIKKIDKSQLI